MTAISSTRPGLLPGADPADDAPRRRPLWSTADGLLPRRDDLVDAVAALALALLAVLGFQNTYLGSGYLVLGLLGAVVGVAAGFVGARFALRLVLLVPLAVLAFALAGGPAVGNGPIAAPAALLNGLTQSWINLLSTAPPVGTASGLGVVPYACGFVAAGGAMLLGRRYEWSVAPIVPAIVVLATGFLFGTHTVVSTLLQGGVFAAVAIGWGAVRANRARRDVAGTIHWPRLVSGVVMLGLVVLTAVPFGSRLPFVDGGRRLVLRDRYLPPFDPRNEPSPLAAFRSYLGSQAGTRVQFTVEGLPAGARLRLATMDTYDGVVWVVGGPTAPASGRFERVGAAIEPIPDGVQATVHVTVGSDRSDVWVPTVGATHGAEFAGAHASELTEQFRYNRATGTGAAANARLVAGDEMTLDAQLPPARDDKALASAAGDAGVGLPALPELPEDLTKKATDLAGTGSSFEQAVNIEKALQAGYYSDGGTDPSGGATQSSPGHSEVRITDLFDNKKGMIGDAEQYAASMALLARSVGLPARVVLGFAPPEGAGTGRVDLHGADIDAWVEIAFVGHGWVPFFPTPLHTRRPPDAPPEKPKPRPDPQKQPPPPTFLEAPDLLAQLGEQHPETPKPTVPPTIAAVDEASGPAAEIAAVVVSPVLVVVGACFAVVLLKARRRTRRRTRGTPVERIGGAWQELCDQAADLGIVIPPSATRREVAGAVPPEIWAARRIADRVDDAMFGFVEPDEGLVAALWEEADRERDAMVASLPWSRRLRSSLSLITYRPKAQARRAREAARAEALAAEHATARAEALAAEAEAMALQAAAMAAEAERLAARAPVETGYGY